MIPFWKDGRVVDEEEVWAVTPSADGRVVDEQEVWAVTPSAGGLGGEVKLLWW